MVYNEPVWARVWARHYSRQVGAENCLVLDHGSTDGSTEGLGVRVERMSRSALDEEARAGIVSACVAALLRGYDAVVHSDADELVVADPARFPDLRAYAESAPEVATAVGLDLQHVPDEEGALEAGAAIGGQRRWVRFSGAMCKPAMVRRAVQWRAGFHSCEAAPVFDGLFLVHLRYADLEAGLRRLARTREQAFATAETNPHQRVSDAVFEGMMRGIAGLPRVEGELGGLAAPWLERVRVGWPSGQLSLAGDALWRLPEGLAAAL